MKQTILILLLFATTQALFAQNFHVQDFREDPSDLAAIRFPVTDVNDDACAIIKVRSNIGGILFDSNLGIAKIDERPDGIWLYVSPGERALRFMRQGVITKDYNFPAGMRIESSKVYILELLATTGEIDDPEIETQWLIITSEPSGADVYINDEPAGRTLYQNELPLGVYRWRVSSGLYIPEEGTVRLESGDDNRKQLNVVLSPNFGTLAIRSHPEPGAAISLNGIELDQTTPATLERLPAGNHQVTLTMEDYATATENVTISAGQQLGLDVDMRPTFALVTVKTDPPADIFVNDQQMGQNQWQGRLRAGVHTFEARLEKHETTRERRQVTAGEPLSLDLKPEPITGNLRITTIPINASVRLGDKDYGTTPTTIRNLLIGEYEVALNHPGHATINERVEVIEGETAEVNVELSAGMEVTISSEPAGAELYINDRRIGATPYTNELSFGSHQLRLVNLSRTVEETIQVRQGGRSNFSFQVTECDTEVTFTYRGQSVTYGVIERGGLCWMDRNLGATRVPTSSTDAQGYGDLFQWGRGDDGHQERTSGTTSTRSNTDIPGHSKFITVDSSPWDWRSSQNNNLWQGKDGLNNPCPPGWRLPTMNEWEIERKSWSSNNSAGALTSPLKLPVAGSRYGPSGWRFYMGSSGYYWSSTVDDSYSRNLHFSSTEALTNSSFRASGYSVRCLKDEGHFD